jgi:hypothetical protein
MKLFKGLKNALPEQLEGAHIGFGFIEAMNYKTEKRGHLFLFSINIKGLKTIKKLFIPI